MNRTLTHASLFSGIGGAEIAAEWMGWANVFHCEINPFGRKVLEYWYPNSISYEDITKTDFSEWRGRINVLTGGFPCQPFSVAGKRKGADDDRYLWPEMLRAIREVQPSWIVGENVAGILTMVQPGSEFEMGSDSALFDENNLYRKEQQFVVETVCQDLERENYSVQPFVIPACSVGAPHRRDRIWFIAHRANARIETMQFRRKNGIYAAGATPNPNGNGHISCKTCSGIEGGRRHNVPQPGERGNETEWPNGLLGLSRDALNTKRIGWNEVKLHDGILDESQEGECGQEQSRRTDCPQGWWRNFPTQSPVCGRDDGFPGEMVGITLPRWRQESVKALGNAWVPQVAYEIFKAIEGYETD